ncbi:type VI secretion system protein ImpK [Polymorphobacter multimanifer]|uniref:Type VI secretion system protein ImpK n=1 Tax=Polymorphobacter multimanifer TaxID=1070431 RepID=A0A841LE79_9SPHN|nr:type IVB secretion system protein IcmH/DotU [Polymorphobacter multimanifer]MBB6227462.1 type VI secretion system protein ImpK [Polymorphobacter multimanifer]
MSGEKTVFRPSPLAAAKGGAPAPPSPPPPPPPGGGDGGGGPKAPTPRAWASDDVPPLDVPMRVRNPLTAVAARLLALAAAVQSDRQVTDVPALRARAGEEAKAFEKQLIAMGLSAEDNARARYAVLATVDDVVQNLPGGAQSDWARSSLVVQSFGQAFGGDQFFTILDTLLQRPAANLDMLELYHACLAVGFLGRARIEADGRQQIEGRMAAIYGALSGIRPRQETDLVPQWQGKPTPMPKVGWFVRAVLALAAGAAFLLLVFLVLKLWLDSRDEPARAALRPLPPIAAARIDRLGADVPEVQSTQLERIRGRLRNPCIEARDDGATIRLVISECPGLAAGMFPAGAALLGPDYVPLIEDAGRALAPEVGPIAVVAHTDSDPISGRLRASFPDNAALSLARAEDVALLLKPIVGDRARLSVEGRGDREPVNRADTREAKAANRRVELVLPRSD